MFTTPKSPQMENKSDEDENGRAELARLLLDLSLEEMETLADWLTAEAQSHRTYRRFVLGTWD